MTAKLEHNGTGQRRLVAYQRRSLELSMDQWKVLDELAQRLGCKAAGGSRTGQPSWRTLLRLIASSELLVKRPA